MSQQELTKADKLAAGVLSAIGITCVSILVVAAMGVRPNHNGKPLQQSDSDCPTPSDSARRIFFRSKETPSLDDLIERYESDDPDLMLAMADSNYLVYTREFNAGNAPCSYGKYINQTYLSSDDTINPFIRIYENSLTK